MAGAFRRKGSRIVGRLDRDERAVLVDLLTQTRALLDPEADGDEAESADPLSQLFASLDRPPPDPEEVARRDPALQRLLPSASRDDEQVAQEFRALTEDSLRRRKSATLATAISAVADAPADRRNVELDLGQAQALMMALADVRLVLGERLGLRTDEDAERVQAIVEEPSGHEDATVYIAALYDLLTWMQECLAQSLLR